MKLFIVFTVVCWGLVLSQHGRKCYDGYKLYEVTPKTEDQAKCLETCRNDPSYDFWRQPEELDTSAIVMVAPDTQDLFENLLANNNIGHKVIIDNIESKIQEEYAQQNISSRADRGVVTFTEYMRFDEINEYLETLERNYPNIVKIEELGESYEGRDLLAVRISSGGSDKPIIFIDGGIHGREWIAPATALYIINQLVENPENDDLYEEVDWVIIPCLNPDGYEYSHTHCYGVDANKNFDVDWGESDNNTDPCNQMYQGPSPFSEKETQALRDYLLANKRQIELYISLHSHGPSILYPGVSSGSVPKNNEELYSLAECFKNEMNTKYTVGPGANVLYSTSGQSDNYAMNVANIELAYTILLPGDGNNGFDPSTANILSIVQETWEGVKIFEEHIVER
ncbi:hypothetical protein NQ314_000802 [Rhamnusium bicolor]|uniref:Zinc carboxypeptidase A 1 n=1 Tax=Rhamnusium bicolor TaxID=1586634 RepID=A0AAV8ZTI9_9CUCU|nr:hypothetical protein NQ314_000802 [Rhamnusium bicolor]